MVYDQTCNVRKIFNHFFLNLYYMLPEGRLATVLGGGEQPPIFM